jgi:hypothetical protein
LGRLKVHDVSRMGSTKRCKIFYTFFFTQAFSHQVLQTLDILLQAKA